MFLSLTMEAIISTETSVLTRAARCHIPEGYLLHGTGGLVYRFAGLGIGVQFVIRTRDLFSVCPDLILCPNILLYIGYLERQRHIHLVPRLRMVERRS
jgi:hypothetical protein